MSKKKNHGKKIVVDGMTIMSSDGTLPKRKVTAKQIKQMVHLAEDWTVTIAKAKADYVDAVRIHGADSDEARRKAMLWLSAMRNAAALHTELAEMVEEKVGDDIIAKTNWDEIPTSES